MYNDNWSSIIYHPKWLLNHEIWILKWFRMAPKMLPKSSKNRSNQVPDGHWIANWVRWRFWDAVRRQNPDQFRPKTHPKSNPDGFKIESDRFPNAIWYHIAFPNRFYIEFDWISNPYRKQKPFKTLMTSFKNGLGVYTTSNAIDNALMIDFSSKNDPKIVPKSLPNWFQRDLEGAWNEDSDSEIKN